MLMAQQATDKLSSNATRLLARQLQSLRSRSPPDPPSKRPSFRDFLPFTSSSLRRPRTRSVHAEQGAAEAASTVPLRSSSARPRTQSARPCGRHTPPEEQPEAPAVADTTPGAAFRDWTTSDAEPAEAASTCGSCDRQRAVRPRSAGREENASARREEGASPARNPLAGSVPRQRHEVEDAARTKKKALLTAGVAGRACCGSSRR